jgi:hypothetical protein
VAGTPKNKASDFTGRQRDAAQKANAEEQARRADEISMATRAAADSLENDVVDLSNPSAPVTVEEVEVELAEKEAIIRVNEDLDMTYGDERYDLKVGPKYKVPQHVADHLDEKGLLWH